MNPINAKQVIISKNLEKEEKEESEIVALFKNAQSLPLITKSTFPFPLLKKIPVTSKHRFLVKQTYERAINEFIIRKKTLTAAISFLENLPFEERILISDVSLNDLNPPNLKKDLKTWVDELKKFFQLLPSLQKVRIPYYLIAPSQFFQVLKKASVSALEIGIKPLLFRFVLTEIPKLKALNSLSFDHYALTTQDLQKLLTEIPKLKALNSLSFDHFTLTTQDLQKLLTSCPGVKSLTLLDTASVVLENLTISQELKYVRLRGKNFNEKSLEFLLGQFPRLKSLDLGSISLDVGSIKTLFQSELALKKLTLAHLPVQDEHFQHVSPSLQKSLSTLILYGCKLLTSDGVALILKTFSNLKHLDVRYTSVTTHISHPEIEVLV